MVRLLEKLFEARNRSVDTPRSPSSGLQSLTRVGQPTPARQIRERRSFRPNLEALEDRLTPSGLNFFPIAHVAVNPQPLPPGGGNEINFPGVYLEEVPLVTNPIPGVNTQSGHLTGFLSKQITLPAATAGIPGQTWTLEAFYNLMVNENVTVTPPDPASGQEGVSASFSMAGVVSEILVPPGP